MSAPSIEVVPSPASACSAMLVGAAAGSGHIVLAGGSTPRAAYEQFSGAVNDLGLDLTGATFWFGDERCVPPDDERSNYRMVKEALLDGLDGSGAPTVRRIEGEKGAVPAADAYEKELREAAPSEFDLVLLGLGPDGHTASLFPDQETLAERSRLAVAVPKAGLEPFVPRVTLTLPALAVARQIAFLVSGASKADAVAAAFGPDARPDPHVPASLLPPLAGEVTVLLDEAAAGRLS
jgi:6-phosphogluconolactonase